MNKQIPRIFIGLAIVGFGVASLLGAFDIINLKDTLATFATYWPLLIVAGGLLILISNPRDFMWSLLVMAAGVLLQLRELNILTFNVWALVWPVTVIAVGLSVLLNRSLSHKGVSKKELDDVDAILSSNSTRNKSDNYKGGDLSAIMGGVDLDLREASIKDEAVLNLFVLCGGITIIVPKEWTIKSTVRPFAGAVEDKTMQLKDGPTLRISGDAIFGSVEIKN